MVAKKKKRKIFRWSSRRLAIKDLIKSEGSPAAAWQYINGVLERQAKDLRPSEAAMKHVAWVRDFNEVSRRLKAEQEGE